MNGRTRMMAVEAEETGKEIEGEKMRDRKEKMSE